MEDSRTLLVISGPTASGKSRLAVELAARFGGTIVNADSRQVYRELPILTGHPSPADVGRVPHRLYGVVPAAEACSVGRWLALARAEIAEARGAGRLPIVVGGTGMYLGALLGGLAQIPPVSGEIRARVRDRLAALGAAGLHAELARRDPATAARLRPTDAQRVARAVEVIEATGRSLLEWQAATAPPSDGERVLTLLVQVSRPRLYAACDVRFLAMLAAGALDEVRGLMSLGLDANLPAMRTVGVDELGRHLAGEISLEAATRQAQQATRNYAKRQLTWFRHHFADAVPVPGDDAEEAVTCARRVVTRFLSR